VSEQHHEGFEPSRRAGVRHVAQGHALGKAEVEEGPMTVFIYVKQVGDGDHLKVFANVDAAETWFEENDSEFFCVSGPYRKREWSLSRSHWSTLPRATGSLLEGLARS
jgi:hypothetical protein